MSTAEFPWDAGPFFETTPSSTDFFPSTIVAPLPRSSGKGYVVLHPDSSNPHLLAESDALTSEMPSTTSQLMKPMELPDLLMSSTPIEPVVSSYRSRFNAYQSILPMKRRKPNPNHERTQYLARTCLHLLTSASEGRIDVALPQKYVIKLSVDSSTENQAREFAGELIEQSKRNSWSLPPRAVIRTNSKSAVVAALASETLGIIPRGEKENIETANDSLVGTSCHQCKIRRPRELLHKCGDGDETQHSAFLAPLRPHHSKVCRKKYCSTCLKRFYADEGDNGFSSFLWLCPSCRGICKCTVCQRVPVDQKQSKFYQTLVNTPPETVVAIGLVHHGHLLFGSNSHNSYAKSETVMF